MGYGITTHKTQGYLFNHYNIFNKFTITTIFYSTILGDILDHGIIDLGKTERSLGS